MANALGSFLVNIVLIFLGVFVMFSAYSRAPILLKLVTLGQLQIDPDSPGRKQRAIVFAVGVVLVLIGTALVVIDKMRSLSLI